MSPKKNVYIRPEIGKEEFVRHIFSLYSKSIGFEVINIQKSFPDCTAIDIRKNRNKKVFIEFEYEAQNFIIHGHEKQLSEEEEYIVVCWESKGIDMIPSNIEVIVLSDKKYKIEISEYPEFVSNKIEKPLYRIIGYNTSVAGGRSFAAFENTKIFRTNIKFKNDCLPNGSVIVLYEKGWLIGEFIVESYIYIECGPKTVYEKNLYRLVGYPVTIDEKPLEYGKWLKGHIIYSNFKMYDPPVNFSILDREMSHGGSLNISYEELEFIRGRKKIKP